MRQCLDDCSGNCEVFKSSLRGRDVFTNFSSGKAASSVAKSCAIDYSHLNILGSPVSTEAIKDANTCKGSYPSVDTSALYGHAHPVRMKMPVFSGAIGSNDIAASQWDAVTVGASICGIALVVGENVCGIDPCLQQNGNGRITDSPELKRRIDLYKSWKDDFGDIIVQINAEDSRLGVAEYVVEKLGVETIELKWGQADNNIETDHKIRDLDRALELRKRGYIVMPNPEDQAIQAAFKAGAIKEFERHTRLGFTDEEAFLRTVEHLRQKLGVKRILLRTSACSAGELALALKWSSKAQVDLLTIDSAGAGAGHWRLAGEWGIPTFYLQSMAYNFARKLAARKEWMPDLALAGGFSAEEHIFKVLAMGAPYFRAVCLGQALMISSFVGDNIDGVLRNSRPAKWNELPKSISVYGDQPEQIFTTYETLADRFGPGEMAKLPLGAVAMYTYVDKLKTGLSQLMAGTRNFRLDTLKRADLVSLTEEAAKISGIPYVMDAGMEEAEKILCG